MALILRTGAIFLHVPKTGGTWVAQVLCELGLVEGEIGHKHADVDRVLYPRENWREGLRYWFDRARGWDARREKPFMFCFVRHPLDWYESWYKYHSAGGSHAWSGNGDGRSLWKWSPCAALDGTGDAEFNRFVANAIRKCPGFVTQLYARYTTDHVDFVGRYETLYEDLIRVLRLIGAECDAHRVRAHPAANRSVSPARPIAWDPALREELVRLEYAALVRYAYARSESV
ncbi:MAG: hypothetical protein OHK0026_07030 [Rhodocyclaceae bacterium]